MKMTMIFMIVEITVSFGIIVAFMLSGTLRQGSQILLGRRRSSMVWLGLFGGFVVCGFFFFWRVMSTNDWLLRRCRARLSC